MVLCALVCGVCGQHGIPSILLELPRQPILACKQARSVGVQERDLDP
jgi:hypothetical protein